MSSSADEKSRLVELADEISRLDGVTVPESLGALGIDPDAFVVAAVVDGDLVGFGSVFAGRPPEIGLAVHPDHRRMGIGLELVGRVCDELRSRGHEDALVVNDSRSEAGVGLLKRLGTRYSHSEFRLERNGDKSESFSPSPELMVRDAGMADRDVLVSLLALSFDDPTDLTAWTVDDGLRETERSFAIASVDDLPIGVVRVGVWSGIGDITALGVLPEFRGRGYGRALLQWAVTTLVAAGYRRIALEVETDNANALGLYQSCGFVVTNEFAYHGLSLTG